MAGPALAAMTWPEAQESAAAGSVLAVPVGSTEQHGPHLPLSTDTVVAAELCARLACRDPAVVAAPALAYGSSGEHEGFAGTVSIGQEALESVVVELCRSATRHFAGVVVVSAHGGNAEPLERAVRRLQGESRRVLAWHAAWSGDAHAGRAETSLLLAVAPGAVRSERAAAGDTRPLPELMGVLRTGGVRAVSPSGVLGDPAGASPEEGAAALESLAATLARAVEAWRAGWAAG